MKLPQIRIESTFARIGMQTEKPVQTIQQRKAVQRIEQPSAIVEIHTVPSELIIDQTEARAQEGFKSTPRLVQEYAETSQQIALEGVSRRVREGDELMEIEKGGNPIREHAINNAYLPQKQLSIGWIPSHGSVKIQYKPAEVQINVTPQKPKIETDIQKPIHEYTPGKVKIYLEQKNSLKIDFVNLFDETI